MNLNPGFDELISKLVDGLNQRMARKAAELIAANNTSEQIGHLLKKLQALPESFEMFAINIGGEIEETKHWIRVKGKETEETKKDIVTTENDIHELTRKTDSQQNTINEHDRVIKLGNKQQEQVLKNKQKDRNTRER